MTHYVGRVLEFRLEPDGRRAPVVSCPPKAVPAPGQFLLAHSPTDPEALLAEPLFLQQRTEKGFLAAPLDVPLPHAWDLGTVLDLRGPLGKGFALPGIIRNLALAALGLSLARLLPLLNATDSAALFTDLPAQDLPAHIEVQPLNALPDAIGWADFMAVDVPLNQITRLTDLLVGPIPPGQALITTPMPCGGLADCGVCTLKAWRKPVLLCVNGPVCELKIIVAE